MILCATNLSFKKINFSKFLSKIEKIGFLNAEIAPNLIYKNPFLLNNKIKIKKILKKNKIKIQSLQSTFYNCKKLNLKKEKDQKYLIRYFKNIVSFAKYFSIKQISVGSCPSRKCTYDNKTLLNLNFFFFKEFSKIVKKNNILLCIEAVTKKYRNNFLNNPNDAINFVKKLNNKNVKFLLDLGNLKSEKIEFKKFFLKNKKLIYHIQLSHKNLTNIDINSVKKSIIFLRKSKYSRTVSIEYLSNKGQELSKLSNFLKTI